MLAARGRPWGAYGTSFDPAILDCVKEDLFAGLAGLARIGIAASGGGDSTALAWMAHEAGLPIVLLHMNYGLRGEESEGDESFVRGLGCELGCEVEVLRVEPESRAEEELRELRYEWFERCKTDVILTGHTLEDQAETLLFRLVRGTGPAGLAGILPEREGRIRRPLLGVRRAELREWLGQRGRSWREDSSNAGEGYRRNWIRQRVLPLLREANPEVDRGLAQLAAIVREEEEWLAGEVESAMRPLVSAGAGGMVLDCSRFRHHSRAMRRRGLRWMMAQVKGDLRGVDYLHIEAALRLCEESEGNGRLQIPGLDLMRSFDWLRVIPLEVLRNMPERNFRLNLAIPGCTEIPEGAGLLQATLEQGCHYNEIGKNLDWECLSAAINAERRLELRNWRPGDALLQQGASEPKKLKELFQKHRIPLWQRRAWPIVVLGDEPVWAGEFGPVAEFAARPGTRTALRIKWTPQRED